MQHPRMQEEGVTSFGTGVTDACELLCGFGFPGLMEKQPGHLFTKSNLSPHDCDKCSFFSVHIKSKQFLWDVALSVDLEHNSRCQALDVRLCLSSGLKRENCLLT